MEQKHHPLVILGFILGGSFLVASLVGAFTVFRLRSLNDVVSVTGSAKMEVTADQGKWTSQISRSVRQSNLKSGYEQIAKDLVVVEDFLKQNGVDKSKITVAPVFMMEIYNQNVDAEKQYTLTQNIEVQSEEVQKLQNLSQRGGELISRGLIYSTNSLEFYYSKLPEARIALLSQAIDDAKARAGELAKNSGKRVGSLKSATSGVVQVQSRNSTDVSDYGSYDTSKIDKQIMVTVKASFTLK
ncbi:MAG TPA: SIMPL domain-containing protein [Candidatus Paceibacterota bacterium]|nr:SIMPL domain-containing protein [Candidatus Paceibacterota bacterium]